MANYMITVDENGSPSLAHYGVLGMRWGVRHDPQKAYSKASTKFKKLATKSDKAFDKSTKYSKRANNRRIGSNKREAEIARRAYQKSKRYAKRASNWYESMQKAFADQTVVSLSQGLISRGDNMIERYRAMNLKNL